MVYNAIGLMSGSSLDGLDIVHALFNEQAGQWSYEIKTAQCASYSAEWKSRLRDAPALSAKEYLLLHADYGHYLGQCVNGFIREHDLEFRISLVASHGHTVFHLPAKKMTSQLGDGSAIAAETRLPVVSDLRAMDVALGGQGAPIVPIGERLLFADHRYFLNIGGIANLSLHADPYIAFDICPANRVLNLLASEKGLEFDEGGAIASSGKINEGLLDELNAQSYYQQPFPKSLANDFGTDTIFPLVKKSASIEDGMRTMVEHIAIQLKNAIQSLPLTDRSGSMLVTGGGAFNKFLVSRLQEQLKEFNIEIIVPQDDLVNYKEALIMAFIGVLRWRQEVNVLSSVTGSSVDSVGGALWVGV